MDSVSFPEFLAIDDIREPNKLAKRWGLDSYTIVPDEYTAILEALRDGTFRIVLDENTYYTVVDCGRDGPRIWVLLGLNRKR